MSAYAKNVVGGLNALGRGWIRHGKRWRFYGLHATQSVINYFDCAVERLFLKPRPVPFDYSQYAATPPENFPSVGKRTLFLARKASAVDGDWAKTHRNPKR